MSKTAIHFDEYPENTRRGQMCQIDVKRSDGNEYQLANIVEFNESFDLTFMHRLPLTGGYFDTMEEAIQSAKDQFTAYIEGFYTPVPYQVAFIAEPE